MFELLVILFIIKLHAGINILQKYSHLEISQTYGYPETWDQRYNWDLRKSKFQDPFLALSTPPIQWTWKLS